MTRDVLLLTMLAFATTACRQDVDLYVGPQEKPDASSYFDFATTADVEIDLNLGNYGSNAFVMLFEEYPQNVNEESVVELKEMSLFSAFADANGNLKTTAKLPAGLEQVYMYCPTWGVPDITPLQIQNGVIRAAVGTVKSGAPARVAKREGERTYTVQSLDNNFYLLCQTTDKYGAIQDVNGIYDTDDLLTAENIASIQNYLWKGKYPKPTTLNNTSLIQSASVINTSIRNQYTDENGVLQTVDGVELWVTMLTEGAWYTNSFGYYYYKVGEDPSTGVSTTAQAIQAKKDIKKYIVFPNVSVPGSFPFSGTNKTSQGVTDGPAENAPLNTNTRVKLLFQQEDGSFTDVFPPGYTVGFFVNVKGWNSQNKWSNAGLLTTVSSETPVCSNVGLNKGVPNLESRFISMSMQMSGKNVIVYGLEDNGKDDQSFDDMLYMIEATPDFAICDEDRNTVDIVQKLGTEKTRYFYAYEDIWPDGGDYDLNDVIIRHDRTITFDVNNYVRKVEDSFTPVQPSGSADYTNAFAVHLDADQRGTLTLPDGAIDETETNSVILFTNTNSSRNQTRTIVREFPENTLLKDKLKIDVETNINPFIIASYNKAPQQDRVEIHLPKATPTAYISTEVYNSTTNAFYIDADGMYPFALALPVDAFEPCSEKVRIDVEYPDYTKWVESKGAQYGTWYLNRVTE